MNKNRIAVKDEKVTIVEPAVEAVAEATSVEAPVVEEEKVPIVEAVVEAPVVLTFEELIAQVKESAEMTYMGKSAFAAPVEFVSYCGKRNTRLMASYSTMPDEILEGVSGKLHWIVKKENGRVKSVNLIHVEMNQAIVTNVPASVAIIIDSFVNKISWSVSHERYKKLANRNDARKSGAALSNLNVKAVNGNAELEGI